jgi:hypothetical protein
MQSFSSAEAGTMTYVSTTLMPKNGGYPLTAR